MDHRKVPYCGESSRLIHGSNYYRPSYSHVPASGSSIARSHCVESDHCTAFLSTPASSVTGSFRTLFNTVYGSPSTG
jgi:hypothetical protein